MNLEEELEFAKGLAREAGQEILRLAKGAATVSYKTGNEVVTSVDREIDALIRREIAKKFPSDGILSEETEDTPERLGKTRVWIADPLDGTKEFVNYLSDTNPAEEYPYFAVHIGLAVGGVPHVGAVSCPVLGQTYYAQKGHGAFVEERGTKRRLHVSDTTALSEASIGIASPEKHNVIALAQELGIPEIQYMESTGIRICAVAAGTIDATININGKTKEWDICAPHVILEEAGGKISAARTPLLYNQPDVSVKSVLATNGTLHGQMYEKFRNIVA